LSARFYLCGEFVITCGRKNHLALGVAAALLVAPLDGPSQEKSTTAQQAAAHSADATTFDPAAATQAWLASVPPDERAKSDAYFEGGYWLVLWDYLLAAAISIFLLGSRISARLRDFAQSLTRFRSAQVGLYSLAYLAIISALSFPLDFYQKFLREHQYGMATQSFARWIRDQCIAVMLLLVLGTILIVAFYAVFRRASRTWPIWGTIVAVVFGMIGMFIAPVYIEPLFNTYKPLSDPAIREPILAMARANEIPVTQVFEVNASRRTRRVSANVAGFLGTTRIALNDNLLRECTLPEIREVMAHEMGHYVLNHGSKLVVYGAILVLVGLAISRCVFDWAVARWGGKWAVHGIADPAGLPLLALIIATYLFLLTPIANTIVRETEREADVFGINTSREPDGMAKVTLKLGAYRKLDPSPLEEFIFFDHPSGRARIRMAMDWKAANLPPGESGAP
jgi:STE24 endopeptidase